MKTLNFTLDVLINQSPQKIFKKIVFLVLSVVTLFSIYSCSCSPLVGPLAETPISSNIVITSNQYTIFLPEDTTNVTASIDLNIMDFYSIDENYDSNDVFVSYEGGVDVALVNTNNLNVDLDNFTISGDISLPQALDFEAPIDADSNNIYEIATFAITNVDGGSNSFALRVMITNSYFLSLHSESATSNVSIYATNLIADVTAIVASNDGDYTIALSGEDASYFELEGNILKTTNDNGFRSIYENDGEYLLQVDYLTNGAKSATFSLTVVIVGIWSEVTNSTSWSARNDFQAVVLENDNVLLMGGGSVLLMGGSVDHLNDIWLSSNEGANWNQITTDAPWPARDGLQAVVLENDNVLLMGGFAGDRLNDIWLSSDGGTNWNEIMSNAPWSARNDFQAVVLENEDILVMGGFDGKNLNDIWLSSDGGTNWNEITSNAPWSARNFFQTVVLENEDILVMGGFGGFGNNNLNDIWLSSDGGTNWNEIEHSGLWVGVSEGFLGFQSVVLENNDILNMSGSIGGGSGTDDIWLSSDGTTNWNIMTVPWEGRNFFQAVLLTNKVLVMGGITDTTPSSGKNLNDVWAYELYNTNF